MNEHRPEPLHVTGRVPDRRGRQPLATLLVTTDLVKEGLAERSSRYVDIFGDDSQELVDAKIARASAMIVDALVEYGAHRTTVEADPADPDGH